MSDRRPEWTSGRLKNGVRYTIWPDPRDTVATVQIWVETGTADEPLGRSGIAHMLEHMMFRGTPDVPDGEFDARAEALGLYVNAATWLDYTFYTATGPAGAIVPLLALEGDRFANLAVAEQAFAPERDVVANERRQMVDAVPEGVLGERFHTALFDGSSYAWPTIGWAKDIDGYTADTVREFHRAFYAPDRLHVVVAGNVDAAEVEVAIEQAFAGFDRPSAPRHRRVAERGIARNESLELAVATPRVLVGWDAPARGADEWPEWAVLDELLAAAETARLTRRLELEDHLTLDMGSMLYPLRDRGALELSLTLRRGVEVDRVLDTLDEELARLADEGPTDQELAGARARIRTRQASALTDTAGRAEVIGESTVLTGDPHSGLDLSAAVDNVDAEGVLAAAVALRDAPRVVFTGLPA